MEHVSRWSLSVVLWPLLIPSLLLGIHAVVIRIANFTRWTRVLCIALSGIATLLALIVTLLMALINFDEMHRELAICYVAFAIAIVVFSGWDVLNIRRQISIAGQSQQIQ